MLNSIFRSHTPGGREWHGLGWLRSVERLLFNPQIAAMAGCLTTLIFLGCMSLNIGCQVSDDAKTPTETKAVSEDNSMLTQEGTIGIRSDTEMTIYYPIPYASTPNLELEYSGQICDVIEQKENCFRIKFHTVFTARRHIHWKARGVRPPPSPIPAEAAKLLPPPGNRPEMPPPPPVPYGSESK